MYFDAPALNAQNVFAFFALIVMKYTYIINTYDQIVQGLQWFEHLQILN